MNKILLAILMMVSGVVAAQTPPKGWDNIPNTNVFHEFTAMVYSSGGNVNSASVWGWTKEQGYIKITVGCSYDYYRIEKDGNTIVNNPYNPGHSFWLLKKSFCY